MITGTCPYKGCSGMVWTSTPEGMELPKYERHLCEECKRVIWTKHSRVDPCSWTERNFLKKYRVNKKTKMIEERNPPKPRTKRQIIMDAVVSEIMKKYITDMMIYGHAVLPEHRPSQKPL